MSVSTPSASGAGTDGPGADGRGDDRPAGRESRRQRHRGSAHSRIETGDRDGDFASWIGERAAADLGADIDGASKRIDRRASPDNHLASAQPRAPGGSARRHALDQPQTGLSRYDRRPVLERLHRDRCGQYQCPDPQRQTKREGNASTRPYSGQAAAATILRGEPLAEALTTCATGQSSQRTAP